MFAVTRVAKRLEEKGSDEFEERATAEYIIQQLIMCITYIDVSDPVSRSVVSTCQIESGCICNIEKCTANQCSTSLFDSSFSSKSYNG